MSYKSILLNGAWGMAYSRDKYTDTVCPKNEVYNPKINISFDILRLLAGVKVAQTTENTNFAFNQNDITAIRKRVEEY